MLEVGAFTLLRSLINPRSNQPNLFLRRRRDLVLIIRRGHVFIFVAYMGDIMHQDAVRAVSGLNDFAILPAFDRRRQRIEPELALLLFRTVTFNAGMIK